MKMVLVILRRSYTNDSSIKTLGEFAMGRNRPNVDDDGGTNE